MISHVQKPLNRTIEFLQLLEDDLLQMEQDFQYNLVDQDIKPLMDQRMHSIWDKYIKCGYIKTSPQWKVALWSGVAQVSISWEDLKEML